MTTPIRVTDHNALSHQRAKLVPRKRAYREALSISDPTIWRWTRAGKLSPADAVINGREYSSPQTIEADVETLMREHGREVSNAD